MRIVCKSFLCNTLVDGTLFLEIEQPQLTRPDEVNEIGHEEVLYRTDVARLMKKSVRTIERIAIPWVRGKGRPFILASELRRYLANKPRRHR
jgi:hypothetical protein